MNFSELQKDLIDTMKKASSKVSNRYNINDQLEHIESLIISMLNDLINKKYYFYVDADPLLNDKKSLIHKYESDLLVFLVFYKANKGKLRLGELIRYLGNLSEFLKNNQLCFFINKKFRFKKIIDPKEFNKIYDYPHEIPKNVGEYLYKEIEDLKKNILCNPNDFYNLHDKHYFKNEQILKVYGFSAEFITSINEIKLDMYDTDYPEKIYVPHERSIFEEYSSWHDEKYNSSITENNERESESDSEGSAESNRSQSPLSSILNKASQHSLKNL